MKTSLTPLYALVALVSCTLPARPLSEARSLESEQGSTTASPYFLVRSGEPGLDALPLKATSVRASIAGVIAEVTVTQIYRNEGSKPLEALYVFPGSTRAAVHAMTMTVGDRQLRARIREKEAARREYQAARTEGRTASLLEQERPNVFQMQVANILPGDEVKVELTYSELMSPREGVYSFVYPTVVGPRYVSGPAKESTGEPAGKPVAPGPLTLEVDLKAGMPLGEITCSSHDIRQNPLGPDHVQIGLKPGSGGDRDFILNYRLAGSQIQSGLLLYKGATENFFLMMMQPPQRLEAQQIPPREFIFIIDVSGSMFGCPLETSKKVVNGLLGGLRPEDRFNLITFAAGQKVWSPEGSLVATAGNRVKGMDFMEQQDGRGGTELVPAFRAALDLPRTDGMARTVILLSDGYVDVEPTILDLIREHLGGTNVFAFGIGSSVNRHLMEGIAHVGQGESFIVTRPEEASKAAERFRRYVSSPVLAQVKVAFQGFDAYDVEPLQVPDVLSDRPILCFGKYRGEATGLIEVSGQTGLGPHHQVLHVMDATPSEDNLALRSLWARHRIQALGDYGLLGGKLDQPEITRLGLTYDLMTQFTSFIAVDSLIRNPGTPAEAVAQPLPIPRGVSGSVSLAPGLALSTARGSTASAVVEVTSTTHDLGGSITLHRPVRVREFQSHPRKSERGPRFHLGQLHSDRTEVPLLRVRQLLEQKLRSLAKAGFLRDLPATFILELNVDATGAVTSVSYDHPLGRGGKLLEPQLLGWRLDTWTVPGTTQLRLAVQVLK